MKDKSADDKPRKLKRSKRLERRFKGVLRCGWCNRWTEVPMRRWQKLRKDELLFPAKYEFLCLRQNCKILRQEVLDELPAT